MTARKHAGGAVSVEFALVLVPFMLLLLGTIEMGRTMFIFNSAAEATRRGARTAVVVPLNDPAILQDMQRIMPDLEAAQVQVNYLPANCAADTCTYVQVSLDGYVVRPLFWHILSIPLPAFQTTLPAESLGAD